jgi:hypothetical protein
MPWRLDTLIIGWPPQAKLERVPGEEDPLHQLFVDLEDKRLLTKGYGARAGITRLDDLRLRVDAIRDVLRPALQALPPRAPIAEWLRKLRDAANELIDHSNEAISGSATTGSEPADVVPAVSQFREAFALVAEHVFDEYELPAARNFGRRDPERHSVARRRHTRRGRWSQPATSSIV